MLEFAADDAATVPRVHVVAPPGRRRGTTIVVPGGGYAGLSPSEAEPVCRWLAESGRTALWLEYDVAPARHPRSLVQLLRTVSAVRVGRWTSGNGPVTVLGFSAGGHLAGLAATALPEEIALLPENERAGCRPDLVAMAYPVTDLTRRPLRVIADNLLGAGASSADVRGVSLARRMTASCPPLFLWHTAEDDSVPAEDSLRLACAAAERHVPVAAHVFPYGPHGISVARARAPLVDAWRGLLLEWLAHHGA